MQVPPCRSRQSPEQHATRPGAQAYLMTPRDAAVRSCEGFVDKPLISLTTAWEVGYVPVRVVARQISQEQAPMKTKVAGLAVVLGLLAPSYAMAQEGTDAGQPAPKQFKKSPNWRTVGYTAGATAVGIWALDRLNKGKGGIIPAGDDGEDPGDGGGGTGGT